MASSDPSERNRLLAALPPDEYTRLMRGVQSVRLHAGQVLAERGGSVPHVYFPRTALLSLQVEADDESVVESACTGNEGMIGVGVFLDGDTAAERVVVQIAGEAARATVGAFREAISPRSQLRSLLVRYALALSSNIALNARCNAAHSVPQRCARRLLLSEDRVGVSTFSLTLAAMASSLSVDAALISEALERLERVGLIERAADRIAILDRRGLVLGACEDYPLGEDAYADIYW